ncbi:hypothetical protein ACIP93_07610 [Streptomyces sp. NPDC088745]|uniref:hypothetical protein n=1 Tax=Streptomyces sp. NPDC088745 TaxID=3365884 RepID=UPI003828A4A9
MTDRRRDAAPSRHPFPLPQHSAGGGLLLRDRKGGGETDAAPDSSAPPRDDNPFAPPPEGTPDRPWQPRKPSGSSEDSGTGTGTGSGWGGQWSNRQPGRGSGGFGGPQSPGRGQNGPEGQDGGPGHGLRWDPTDPVQRRARYALLAGMWAFFFAVFTLREIALLLGALALYWGISSLRNRTEADPATSTRPQTTAAVSGLVTAGLALLIVAATFTAQLVYRDYYTCVADSLTKSAQVACNEELPKSLVPMLGVRE